MLLCFPVIHENLIVNNGNDNYVQHTTLIRSRNVLIEHGETIRINEKSNRKI